MTDKILWRKGQAPKALVHSQKNHELYSCERPLQQAFYQIREAVEAKFPGMSVEVIHGHRTQEQQFEIFKKGRVTELLPSGGKKWVKAEGAKQVTNCDGYVISSDHNEMPSKAMDLMIVNDKRRAVWDRKYYNVIGYCCDQMGLKWGGKWKSKDLGHVYVLEDQ